MTLLSHWYSTTSASTMSGECQARSNARCQGSRAGCSTLNLKNSLVPVQANQGQLAVGQGVKMLSVKRRKCCQSRGTCAVVQDAQVLSVKMRKRCRFKRRKCRRSRDKGRRSRGESTVDQGVKVLSVRGVKVPSVKR